MAPAGRWIEVIYKCQCMPAEATVQVKERTDEEIEIFMGRVQLVLMFDHKKRSPLCMAEKMEYCKIPVAGDKIGGGEGGTA